MGLQENVRYRLALAQGYLREAEQYYSLQSWRLSVSGSILVIENTGLAVLMLFGVSPFTHKPGKHLSQLVAEGTLSKEVGNLIEEILPELEKYDSHEKMLVKYGDESQYKLPWDLFHEEEGLRAIEAARKCMEVGSRIAALVQPEQ